MLIVSLRASFSYAHVRFSVEVNVQKSLRIDNVKIPYKCGSDNGIAVVRIREVVKQAETSFEPCINIIKAHITSDSGMNVTKVPVDVLISKDLTLFSSRSIICKPPTYMQHYKLSVACNVFP